MERKTLKLLKKLKLSNPGGLHVRSAAMIVKKLQFIQSEVFFTYNNQTVNAKSIMSLLFLSAGEDAILDVSIEGTDAEEVLTILVDIFEGGRENNER